LAQRKRSGDPLVLGLEIVGGRWTFTLIVVLLEGPRAFGDLKTALPGISANVLAQRLRQLSAAGILRHAMSSGRRSRVYELTPWGLEMEAVHDAMRHGCRTRIAAEAVGPRLSTKTAGRRQ